MDALKRLLSSNGSRGPAYQKLINEDDRPDQGGTSRMCGRCEDNEAKVRARSRKDGFTEYLCYECIGQDPQLKNIPVAGKNGKPISKSSASSHRRSNRQQNNYSAPNYNGYPGDYYRSSSSRSIQASAPPLEVAPPVAAVITSEQNNILDAIPPPEKCEHCQRYPPHLRIIDPATGSVEFICLTCQESDQALRNIPLSTK